MRKATAWVPNDRSIDARKRIVERIGVSTSGGFISNERLGYGKVIVILRNHSRETAKLAAKTAEEWGVEEEGLHKARRMIRKIAIDTRTKDFAFRLMKGLLYTNSTLHKMGVRDNKGCCWCNEENHSITHMLRDCSQVQGLIRHEWHADIGLKERVIAIRTLQYIYSCNFNDERPSAEGLYILP